MLKRTLFVCVAVLLLIAGGQMMKAQDQGGGGGGGFQMPSADEMKQNMLDRLKTQTGADDATWTAIQPKVEAVMAKRLPMTMGGGFGGMRGGPGGGGPGGPGGGNRGAAGGPGAAYAAIFGAPIPEQTALMTALYTEGTSDADIKAKLDAYVAAYKKRAEEAKAAQAELAKAVGDKAKLKAVLMLNGYIPVE